MEHLFAVQALSELTDVMPDAGGSVFVAGHSLPGDGGGGMFQWIAESTDPHDGGVVIAGDNQVGRWHRVEVALDDEDGGTALAYASTKGCTGARLALLCWLLRWLQRCQTDSV